MRLRATISSFLLVACLAAPLSAALAFDHPEFFGGYAVVDDKLQELPAVKVNLKSYTLGKNTVAAFAGLPSKLPVVATFTPKLILYDQAVSVGGVHLSRLAPVPLGKSASDGFAWTIVDDVPVKVKPLEEQGMFYFVPQEHLSSGYYALYGGASLVGGGVTSGSVFAFEVQHPQQADILSLLTQFIEAARLQDAAALSERAVTVTSATESTPLLAVSEDAAAGFKKPGFYTMGGDIGFAGIREGTDPARPGSIGYYCVDVNIYGALVTVTVNGKTLTGDSPKQMIVSEVEPGKFKVFTQKQFWMYTDCK